MLNTKRSFRPFIGNFDDNKTRNFAQIIGEKTNWKDFCKYKDSYMIKFRFCFIT
jgi:hypothetical protein